MTRTLDCTRWIAAGLVVLYHIRLNVLVDQPAITGGAIPSWVVWLWYRVTDCGPQAVFWFFVTSGFLIGGKVIEDFQQGRFNLGAFIIARASRLYVVLVPALAIGLALDLHRVNTYGLTVEAGSESAASYTIVTLIANLFFLQTIIAPTAGSNLPLWSLACEAWYYLMFPLMMIALSSRRASRQRLIALVSLAIIGAVLSRNPKVLAYFTIWLLGTGVRICPVALVRSRIIATVLAALAVLAYPTLATTPVSKTIAVILVAVSFANLLLTANHARQQRYQRAYGSWHAALAAFSYSLYVIHAPLLHAILVTWRGNASPRLQLEPGWLPVTVSLVLLAMLYGYAWIFSQFTELHTAQVRKVLHHAVTMTRARLMQ